MRRVIVAYSGGVDSTFLLKVAKDVLADNVVAVGSVSKLHPLREVENAKNLAKTLGVEYIPVITNELSDENFTKNSCQRCYHCKNHLFSFLSKIAKKEGVEYIVDGSHCDDLCKFRVGMVAMREWGIRSPLLEANLGKADIRRLSKEFGLPTWNKPAAGCLALHLPYYIPIKVDELIRLDKAERFLASYLGGQASFFVDLDCSLRIKIPANYIAKLIEKNSFKELEQYFKQLGYKNILKDVEGCKGLA